MKKQKKYLKIRMKNTFTAERHCERSVAISPIGRLIATLIFVVFAIHCSAQDVVDLSMLIDRVLTENYQVKIVRNEAQQAANNNTIGNAGFLPTVDLQGTNSRAWNNTRQKMYSGDIREGDNAETKILNGYIEAAWTVFDGFRMFATRDKLFTLEQIGNLDAKYFIEQTITDVSIAYYQLVSEINLLENLQKTLAVSQFRYKLQGKKRNVGAGTTLDYNLAIMDYHSDSLAVIRQEQVIKSLQIQLNRLTKQDLDIALKPANKELTSQGIGNKEALAQQAVESNKSIRLSMLQEIIADKNIRIAKSSRYPEVNLTGRYSFSRQNMEIGVTQENRTYGTTIGINVRMNLFDGLRLRQIIKNEELTKENTSLMRQNTTDIVTSEILDCYYEYQSLLNQQSLAKQNILLAESSQSIASVQLEGGSINGYDFRQTQLAVINAQNQLIRINFSLKALEIEIGRLTGQLSDVL